MKPVLYYIISIVVALGVASCDPIEIDADLPDRNGLITITGLFATDSAWRVDVNSSKGILDSKVVYGIGETDLTPITNAQVTIRENSQVQDKLIYSPYTFITEYWAYRPSKPDIHPAAGKTYDIEVTVPNVGTATSTCFVPSPATLVSVTAAKEMSFIDSYRINGTSKDHTGFAAVPTEIVIDDPAGENYYEIIVRYDFDDNRVGLYWATPTFTKDMRFHSTGITPGSGLIIPASNNPYYSVIFRDDNIEAKQLKLSLMMPVLWTIEGNENVLLTDLRYMVILRTLSREYFQYTASQELQAYAIDDRFAQPVVIYGNVKGGVGIFAGYSEDAMAAEFK